MPSVFRLAASYHVRRIVPPESFGSSALPACAPIERSTWSPPKIAVCPLSSTSVVASTTFFDAPDRVDQRVVVARGRLLGELDVERDRLRAVLAQAVEHLGVQAARERPLHLEVVERLRVDGDDRDVVGLRLRPADAEARVDRPQLDALQRAERVEAEHDAGRRDPGREEQREAQALAPLTRGDASSVAVGFHAARERTVGGEPNHAWRHRAARSGCYQCTPLIRFAIATCSIEAFSLGSFSPLAAAESGKTL